MGTCFSIPYSLFPNPCLYEAALKHGRARNRSSPAPFTRKGHHKPTPKEQILFLLILSGRSQSHDSQYRSLLD